MRSDNIQFKDIFWNTLGTVTYSAVSLFISIVVIDIQGKIEGGIFSFGYSTLAHLVFVVAYFGIRPMHIVDIKYRYGFNDYKNFGLLISCIAAVLGTAYIVVLYTLGNYSMAKSLILFLLVIHGAIDGFADYYECEYQRVNRLYMCGQSLFFRTFCFTVSLIISLLYTKNLLYAETVAIIVEIAIFYILNIKRSRGVFKTAVQVGPEAKNKNLFVEALPLFMIVFFDMYIFSATKFSVDINLGDTYNGFFNIIFMPTNVIYLVMNLIMKPVLTPLSNAYYNDKSEYNKILGKTILVALIISLVAIIGTYVFGGIYIDIVGAITGNVYTEFASIARKILLIVIIGGCFYTVNTPLYFSLIIERKQKFLVISYIVVCILSVFVAHLFVVNLGIMGAAYGFLTNMFLLCLGVFIVKILN